MIPYFLKNKYGIIALEREDIIMKAAISTDGEYVSAHFGRCPSFTIFDVENNNIVNKERIDNPGHHPGYIPQFLYERGVECIITGGMGMRARNLFDEYHIMTILGITGRIDYVIEEIKNGTLKGGESLCRPGAGKGYGYDKTECDHGSHDH
jgi:predicted Fe-Mo cluster-binding NifX family protein